MNKEQLKHEFEGILEGIGWEYDYGGRADANKLFKWFLSKLENDNCNCCCHHDYCECMNSQECKHCE